MAMEKVFVVYSETLPPYVVSSTDELEGNVPTAIIDSTVPNDDDEPANDGMVGAARRKSLLPRISMDEVTRMSLKEALAAARTIYDPRRLAYYGSKDPSPEAEIVGSILRENRKLEKTAGVGKDIKTNGLVLLPHQFWSPRLKGQSRLPSFGNLSFSNAEKDRTQAMQDWDDWAQEQLKAAMGANWKTQTSCAGASSECKAACLAGSGNNMMRGAVVRKMADMVFLFTYPVHFFRIVTEHIERKRRQATVEGWKYATRLNVLSDYPWEAILDGFFEYFKGHQFYDYTKVAGRRPPKNYYLVFSWSGVNARQCAEEIESGKNIAMPIAGWDATKGKFITMNYRTTKLPSTINFNNEYHKVIDGDLHDARFTDKPRSGAIVGLRYKASFDMGVAATRFAVAANVIYDGMGRRVLIMPETPFAHRDSLKYMDVR